MDNAKQKLIAWLESQLGYRECGDNDTKYADTSYDTDLYGFDMHGKPWCDFFVDIAFIINFGYETGIRMTYQYPQGSAACAQSAKYYKENNKFFKNPEIGDQIFFFYGGDINHTGVVVNITSSTVVTIEGNSSDSVRKNTYYLTDNSIAGYGRPNWELAEANSFPELCDACTDVKENYILRNGTGLNNPDPIVVIWQGILYHRLSISQPMKKFIDGEFGGDTEYYTKKFQRENGLPDDGIVNTDDWKKAFIFANEE